MTDDEYDIEDHPQEIVTLDESGTPVLIRVVSLESMISAILLEYELANATIH